MATHYAHGSIVITSRGDGRFANVISFDKITMKERGVKAERITRHGEPCRAGFVQTLLEIQELVDKAERRALMASPRDDGGASKPGGSSASSNYSSKESPTKLSLHELNSVALLSWRAVQFILDLGAGIHPSEREIVLQFFLVKPSKNGSEQPALSTHIEYETHRKLERMFSEQTKLWIALALMVELDTRFESLRADNEASGKGFVCRVNEKQQVLLLSPELS
ncbi:unnamed protein product, partial [Amoebophrya sp. A25]|eukprot:GSA25T00027513001.1